MFEIAPPALESAGGSAEELFEKILGYGYLAYLMESGKLQRVERVVRPTYHGIGLYGDNYLFKPPPQ